MNQKTKMRYTSEKGITLIALVITIIVLLILAGVTISMVLGDDGIIAQATQAKKENEDSSLKDAVSVAKAEAATTQYIEQTPMSDLDLNIALGKTGEEVITNNNTVAKVEDGVPIPVGFAYVEGTKKDTGLIVVDGYGNEYVWVPVENPIYDASTNPTGMFNKTTNGDGSITYTGNLYDWTGWSGEGTPSKLGSSYVEPQVAPNSNNITDNMQEEFNEMAESVETYGGFFVGRYETGGFNSTKVVSKAGEDQASCTNVDWYTMYRMQKELYGESASVVSSMIYGSQWDAILDWMSDVENPKAVDPDYNLYITDSTGMGHYCYDADWDQITDEEGPIKTGLNSNYAVKNIFDLAGNYFELTQEAYEGIYRTRPGGSYGNTGSDSPASCRYFFDPANTDDMTSSRLQLYIK